MGGSGWLFGAAGAGSLLGIGSNSSAQRAMKKANKLMNAEYVRQNAFMQNEAALTQQDRKEAINDMRYSMNANNTNDNGFISDRNIKAGTLVGEDNYNITRAANGKIFGNFFGRNDGRPVRPITGYSLF